MMCCSHKQPNLVPYREPETQEQRDARIKADIKAMNEVFERRRLEHEDRKRRGVRLVSMGTVRSGVYFVEVPIKKA